MGKSNRIRNDRAKNTTLATVKTKKKKQGMPSWAMNVITVAVAAVILFSVAFSLLSANGVFSRMQTAMKSEHYRVDANMMKYFFQSQYSNLVSQNSSTLTSMGLDTSKSLKDPTNTVMGSEGTTWFDYIMSSTQAQVKEMLVYCEEADANGWELDEDTKASIDAEIEMIETYAQMYGYTTSAYVAQMYGKGVKIGDVRNCLELTALAELAASNIGKTIEGGITDEDISGEYDANKQDYDLVDMLSYTFSVTYTKAQNACAEDADEVTVIDKYKELIAEAKAKAEALEKVESVEAYKDLLIDYVLDETYDEEYKDADEDTETAVASEDKPQNDGDEDKIKAAIIAHIKPIVLEDKEFKADDIVVDGKIGEVAVDNEAYVTFIKDVATAVYNSVHSTMEAVNEEGKSYSESDEAVKWAFGDDSAVGQRDIFENGDTEIKDGAVAADLTKTYSAETVYLTKKPYRDEKLTKNVGIMVFTTEDAAKAALEKLSAGMTLEAFEQVANDNGGTYSNYENYTEGSLNASNFDAWLYKDETVIGSYTTEIISVTSSSSTTYVLALYHADGDAEWTVTVKSAIYSERFSANLDTLMANHAITVKDKVIARIDA